MSPPDLEKKKKSGNTMATPFIDLNDFKSKFFAMIKNEEN